MGGRGRAAQGQEVFDQANQRHGEARKAKAQRERQVRRNVRFRPKLRDTVKANVAYLAAMSPGGELPDDLKASHETLVAGLPKQRGPRADGVDIDKVHGTKRTVQPPLEKDIQRAILAALRLHPCIAFVGRFNRGVMQSTYQGRDSYTQFNTVPGFPDIHGMLKGGAAFYIEVKRPGKKPDDTQANFLASVTRHGGIAGVATSVEEATALIAPPVQR